jgi:hypothetical protein
VTWTVRQIPESDRYAAAQRVREWGYPRPIELSEIRAGFWVRDVPERGILWLTEGPIVAGHWCVHAQPHPDHTQQFLEPRVFELIRTLGGLLGASRVYAPLGSTRPGWQRYLMRYGGFEKRDELGPYFELAEG